MPYEQSVFVDLLNEFARTASTGSTRLAASSPTGLQWAPNRTTSPTATARSGRPTTATARLIASTRPRTRSLGRTTPGPRRPDCRSPAATSGSAQTAARRSSASSPRTNRLSRIDVHHQSPAWFAADATHLWVASNVDDVVLHLDPRTGKVLAAVKVGLTPGRRDRPRRERLGAEHGRRHGLESRPRHEQGHRDRSRRPEAVRAVVGRRRYLGSGSGGLRRPPHCGLTPAIVRFAELLPVRVSPWRRRERGSKGR